jgi:hypothetical protein
VIKPYHKNRAKVMQAWRNFSSALPLAEQIPLPNPIDTFLDRLGTQSYTINFEDQANAKISINNLDFRNVL